MRPAPSQITAAFVFKPARKVMRAAQDLIRGVGQLGEGAEKAAGFMKVAVRRMRKKTNKAAWPPLLSFALLVPRNQLSSAKSLAGLFLFDLNQRAADQPVPH